MKLSVFVKKYPLPYFNIHDIGLYFDGAYRNHIRYWLKSQKIISLMRGRYMFSDVLFNQGLRFELSNKLYAPSYISLETALSYYSIIPEGVRVTTCVSTKKTQKIQTPKGIYMYQSIKHSMFWGYIPIEDGERRYLIATPEKAIIDYLYLHHEIGAIEDIKQLRRDAQEIREIVDIVNVEKLAKKYANSATLQRVYILKKYLDA